jgi:hypothetical protein
MDRGITAMKPKPQITPEQAAELETRTIANVIEKISSGAVPTAREIEMLRAATAEPPPPPASPADAEVETFGPRLNIRQLSRLTGKMRETIGDRLHGLPHILTNGHKLYDTQPALELIYVGKTGDDGGITEAESRRRLNIAKTRSLELDDEIKRKTRIPIDLILDLYGATYGQIVAVIKAHHGRLMTLDAINECFAALRGIEVQAKKWKAAEIPPKAPAAKAPTAKKRNPKPRKK